MNISELQIHTILANERRQVALDQLRMGRGPIAVRELSHYIAEVESGLSPPPKPLRESVYSSLVQTHLPTLHEAGVVVYDCDLKEVTLSSHARSIQVYQDIFAIGEFTWADLYRGVGLVGFLAILGSLLDAPGVSVIDPLLWTSFSLFLLATVSVYQLWTYRFSIYNLLSEHR
ncbi:DUF7344 domain-containing protein [Natronocalculus amylovorans]|uniref:DUF7344 domain-containing protein n=1 Tax=Natronocalculus amylovorans TaxID=2917812 RepID=A0AAE3K987_9EURY|nr:hypothetical protein [Natronocalculus amylovorans]MCL9817826.1 hypothetical protein [Natronocalculus amylovorans]